MISRATGSSKDPIDTDKAMTDTNYVSSPEAISVSIDQKGLCYRYYYVRIVF